MEYVRYIELIHASKTIILKRIKNAVYTGKSYGTRNRGDFIERKTLNKCNFSLI